MAVQSFESSSAIGEWRKPTSEDPSGKPSFCCLEALESLDGLQSSLQLLIVAFDEIRCSRATVVEEILRFHVACQQIAVVEDVLQRVNLQMIVVVTRRSPADVTLQIRLPEVGKIEDLLFEVREEVPVGCFASDFECPADVLEEMHVAELNDATGVDRSRRHADGFVVVTDKTEKLVAGVLELREVLEARLVVLRGGEETDRNVMRQVVDTVDERNLPVVAFDCHVLAIHHEEAAEALGIAVLESDVIVVREPRKLPHNSCIRRVDAFADHACERADARTLEVSEQEWFLCWTVIDAETSTAIVAAVAFQASPRAVALRVEAAAGFAGKTTASCCVFFGVNMFKVGKMASPCYRSSFVDTRNRTLSSSEG